jgi:4-hydroxy-2-oxoheptanedioate aldolase
MRKSNIRAKMTAGEKAIGFGITFPSVEMFDIVGHLGFDYAHLDAEHGVFDFGDVEDMCRIADMHNMTCTARIPNIDSSTILRFLDRGIMGILAPHISNRDEAEQAARACRYGPEGERSFGTGRGRDYGLRKPPAEYMAEFNHEMVLGVQIETAEGVEKIDEILEVDGIDYITFGPADLAQSLGHPGDAGHADVQAAMESVRQRVRGAGRLMSEDVMEAMNFVMWMPPLLEQWLENAKSSN